jgi:hypothetical protein
MKNKIRVAKVYMKRAYLLYSEWGAIRKLELMNSRYSHLLPSKAALRDNTVPATIYGISSATDSSSNQNKEACLVQQLCRQTKNYSSILPRFYQSSS